ncbi:MAG: UbiX family flavin prenyltransferase [Planctomycetes bacterium]|nr:UbiX family flavin prenyltransferase [Planctomycetota bacterium]
MRKEAEVKSKKIVVALTGASGTIYGIKLIRTLKTCGHEALVVISDAAREVMALESAGCPDFAAEGIACFGEREISAPMASGSFHHDGMVIVPCTMASLSAVACGQASNLTHRAADVTLKEGRTLILVPRETPLNRIHLENMLRAHDAGAVIMPAMPGFYGKPATLDDLVAQMTGRILDRLGIENDLAPRWGKNE